MSAGEYDGVADGLLRPALEAALVVAREGEEETPAVDPPAPLRPFLRFAKLPPRALAVARKALDADGEFRSRVAEATDEQDVGRAGWLYLTRPEGWEEELAALVADAADAAREHADRRAEHDARRRLASVQEAARRADELAAAARAEAADERRARQAATDAAATAAREVEAVTVERDRLRAALATVKAEAESLRRKLAEAEVERDQLRVALEERGAATPPVGLAVPEPEPEAPLEAVSLVAPERPSPVPALQEAAEAAARLAESLRAAVVALGPDPPPPAAPTAFAPVAERAPAVPPTLPPRRAPTVRRQPAPLPPAVFDDSVEAAEHLVRVPGIVLVVDGYNVSLTGWPELPIAEQRRRLVNALAELAARTGTDTRVVFDGSDVALPGIVPTTPKAVRVSFSPPGVEADEVVIDLAGQLPLSRPVLVATSDRRVQHECGRAGANVISSEQLLAVLRR